MLDYLHCKNKNIITIKDFTLLWEQIIAFLLEKRICKRKKSISVKYNFVTLKKSVLHIFVRGKLTYLVKITNVDGEGGSFSLLHE